ncbi:SDR family oxidoreductase [Solirubrobacter ginsenosidimutans]|uniref:SDR family oxidoreductase n=1 Tax=Solirubrobacter ginsenosidimutans TaxID=490573 RepID=A0A9X3MMP4_9ACTN|nr:SDR family oxidoreductase [Solirubrobacter ginsenosidimutans]MDA0159084.1 SDR family oxidoreductase [Solirubrobacter ginsenosidimutans]
MSDWLGLAGRRVVIAGGAGGFGAAITDAFRAAGAQTAVIDVAGGDHIQADLRDAGAARAAMAEAADRLGGVDVFVHAVGINRRKPIDEYTDADWDDIVAINLSSAFWTARAALPKMREQGFGRIVFFSSVAGRSGHKHHGPYAATKGAINQLMRVMAHESAADGVTVNAVAPGYMDTELTRQYLADHPGRREALIELIPAGRFARIDEVVGPVLFLCSKQASFVTGTVLYIDGGRSVI